MIADGTGRLVIAILEVFAQANSPVILDRNFNTPEHGTQVRDFVQIHDVSAVEVCLWGDPIVLRARFIDRADPPLTENLALFSATREGIPVRRLVALWPEGGSGGAAGGYEPRVATT
jgi:hypothetical protein